MAAKPFVKKVMPFMETLTLLLVIFAAPNVLCRKLPTTFSVMTFVVALITLVVVLIKTITKK